MLEQTPDCSNLCQFLDAFYDGELPEQEAKAIAQHLDQCPHCQARLDEIGNLVMMVQRLPRLKMPHDVQIDALLQKHLKATDANSYAPVNGAIVDNLFRSNSQTEPARNDLSLKKQSSSVKLLQRKFLLSVAVAAIALFVLGNFVLHIRPLSGPAFVARRALSGPGQINHEVVSQVGLGKSKVTNVQLGPAKTKMSGGNDRGNSSELYDNPLTYGGSLVALDSSEVNLVTEQLGISTDEDGLYALKL